MKDEEVAIALLEQAIMANWALMFALNPLLKNSDSYDWIEDESELRGIYGRAIDTGDYIRAILKDEYDI